MAVFQQRLDQLVEKQPTPDTVDRLLKEMEAQRGIDDVLIKIKYRESQQANFTAFSAAIGAVGAALISGIVTWGRGSAQIKDLARSCFMKLGGKPDD